MIAAASFGLRRSGTFATATSGAAYWAASVRHGPPWPLPVIAPAQFFGFPDQQFLAPTIGPRAQHCGCPRGVARAEGDELAYKIERGRVIMTKAVRTAADDPFAKFRRAYGDL